jgi:choline dehydrogenase
MSSSFPRCESEYDTGPFSIALSNLCAWLPLTVITDTYDELATKLEQQDFASLLPAGAHDTVVAGYKAQMEALAAQMRSKTTAFMRMQLLPASGSQGPVIMQSFARGTININASDPWNTEPVVDYRALTNPVESDVFVAMIRFVRHYSFNTSLAATLDPYEYVPGAEVVSDEDLKAYLANVLSPSDYHPVGTCSMLPLELGGVVNRNLRVYGVGKLRIVDASIIPMLPSANTCQPTYAIAEKAADIIKSTQT